MKTFDDLLLAYTGRDAAHHERAKTIGLDFARYVYAAMSAAPADLLRRERDEAIASADHAIRLFDEMRNDRDRLVEQIQKIAEKCCDDVATDGLDALIAASAAKPQQKPAPVLRAHRLLATARRIATGDLAHQYFGGCPESGAPDSRSEHCPACRELIKIDRFLMG